MKGLQPTDWASPGPAGLVAPQPRRFVSAAVGAAAHFSLWRSAPLSPFGTGFALFASHVSHLATPDDPGAADAIIVLTGGQARIDAALDLLHSGKGERLLISGVNPMASRDTLRAATGGDRTLFNCCVDIDHAALDTIGNAEESAKWVASHAYRQRYPRHQQLSHAAQPARDGPAIWPAPNCSPYPVVNTKLDDGAWIIKPDALAGAVHGIHQISRRSGPRRVCRLRNGRREPQPGQPLGRRPNSAPASVFLSLRPWCNEADTLRSGPPCSSSARWRSTSSSMRT